MEKHLNQNSFNFFTPFDSRVNIQIFFSFKFTLRCQQSVSHYLPPVSTTPAVPVAIFAAGVVDTRWCTLTCKYLRISAISFERNRNDPNYIFRGLGEEDS